MSVLKNIDGDIIYKSEKKNLSFRETLKEALEQDRLEYPLDNLDARKQNLSNFKVSSSNFLSLKGANFSESNLDGAHFSDTNLNGAKFMSCSLNNTSFEGSKLDWANFNNSIGEDIDFRNSSMKNITFKNIRYIKPNFSNVKNLDLIDENIMHEDINISNNSIIVGGKYDGIDSLKFKNFNKSIKQNSAMMSDKLLNSSFKTLLTGATIFAAYKGFEISTILLNAFQNEPIINAAFAGAALFGATKILGDKIQTKITDKYLNNGILKLREIASKSYEYENKVFNILKNGWMFFNGDKKILREALKVIDISNKKDINSKSIFNIFSNEIGNIIIGNRKNLRKLSSTLNDVLRSQKIKTPTTIILDSLTSRGVGVDISTRPSIMHFTTKGQAIAAYTNESGVITHSITYDMETKQPLSKQEYSEDGKLSNIEMFSNNKDVNNAKIMYGDLDEPVSSLKEEVHNKHFYLNLPKYNLETHYIEHSKPEISFERKNVKSPFFAIIVRNKSNGRIDNDIGPALIKGNNKEDKIFFDNGKKIKSIFYHKSNNINELMNDEEKNDILPSNIPKEPEQLGDILINSNIEEEENDNILRIGT